jgi:hypothetical protein
MGRVISIYAIADKWILADDDDSISFTNFNDAFEQYIEGIKKGVEYGEEFLRSSE